MNINIKVDGQNLYVTHNLHSVIDGSKEFIKFVFDLPDEWKELNPTVQFIQGATHTDVVLDSSYSATLPSDLAVGDCHVILYGLSGKVRAVTEHLTIKIKENMLIEIT